MENRIKEQFVLFADRVSSASMRANQLRLYLSAMAYSLLCGLRRLGLQATHLAHAQAGTIRVRLLKIGAQIRVTVRRILGTDVQQLSAANSLPPGASTTPLLKLMRPRRATRSLTTSRSSPQSDGEVCLSSAFSRSLQLASPLPLLISD